MSEEEKEAIEILKDNIGILEGKLTIKYINYNTVKAYNTILNLINNQQKEIEELKSIHNEFLKLHQELKAEGTLLSAKNILDIIHKRYISKDKIIEKIKELEQIQNTALTGTTMEIMDYKITILKQLLEE